MPPIMGCGHSANATDAAGQPCCVICVGIKPGAVTVAEQPDLTGRKAFCFDCRKETPSNTNLAFFQHIPSKDFDSYYCGCHGWN